MGFLQASLFMMLLTKSPGSYKKFQGRNSEIISLVFWLKLLFHKDIIKLTLVNKKLHFLLIIQKQELYFAIIKPCRYQFEANVLIKSGYYIGHSPSTALIQGK